MACSAPRRAELRKRRITKHCFGCGKPFEAKNYRKATAKFCSRACWSKRSLPSEKRCLICGSDFITYQRTQQYCSRSCARKSAKGPKHPRWKGGVAKTERERLAAEISRWRRAVYERDKFTCQRCGYQGKNLHAHHIKHWAKHPELRFEISNGETLCHHCHSLEHGKELGNRRVKTCCDCGCKTTGRGLRCRPCGIAHWHATRRASALTPFFPIFQEPH